MAIQNVVVSMKASLVIGSIKICNIKIQNHYDALVNEETEH